jgi:single-stranded DNA-binding protein
VVGRLKQDRWNGPDGKPRTKVSIVAEHVEFRPELREEEARREAAGPEFPENLPPNSRQYAPEAYAEEYAAEMTF